MIHGSYGTLGVLTRPLGLYATRRTERLATLRADDVDQVTVGLSSRFIHPESGIERVRVALAQRDHEPAAAASA